MRGRLVWPHKMRVRLVGELGKLWPENAKLNIDYYEQRCKDNGLIKLGFRVDGLPISLNNHYEMGTRYCKPGTPGAFKDGTGRWRVRSNRLRPGAIDWRLVVMETMGRERWLWKPTGVTAAILLFESPDWLKKDRSVREMDADNLVKGTFDAVQSATETPDQLHWEFHVYKVLSKRRRTTIRLYDVGSLVDYYY